MIFLTTIQRKFQRIEPEPVRKPANIGIHGQQALFDFDCDPRRKGKVVQFGGKAIADIHAGPAHALLYEFRATAFVDLRGEVVVGEAREIRAGVRAIHEKPEPRR